MADPTAILFNGQPFRGTGRVEDYFPGSPDLSYLSSGRPAYVPEGNGYDSSLDLPALVQRGVPPTIAHQFQGLRAQFHQAAAQRRAMQDEQGAMAALDEIDPSRETFAKDLLGIFRKYPTADRSPSFTRKVDLVSQLARMMPTKPQVDVFDIATIKDPDIRRVAIEEKWDTLPKSAAEIRHYDMQDRKRKRLELIETLGVSPEELDDYEKKGRLSDEYIAFLKTQAKQRPEHTLTPEAAKQVATLQSEAALDPLRKSDEWKLEWLRSNIPGAKPDQTEFPDWAWRAAWNEANKPVAELQAYTQALQSTPTNLPQGAPVQSTGAPTPSAPPVQIIDDTTITINGKRYKGTPDQIKAYRAKHGF